MAQSRNRVQRRNPPAESCRKPSMQDRLESHMMQKIRPLAPVGSHHLEKRVQFAQRIQAAPRNPPRNNPKSLFLHGGTKLVHARHHDDLRAGLVGGASQACPVRPEVPVFRHEKQNLRGQTGFGHRGFRFGLREWGYTVANSFQGIAAPVASRSAGCRLASNHAWNIRMSHKWYCQAP